MQDQDKNKNAKCKKKWENIFSEYTQENTESRRKNLARGPKGRHPHSPAEQAGASAGLIVSKNGRASMGAISREDETKPRRESSVNKQHRVKETNVSNKMDVQEKGKEQCATRQRTANSLNPVTKRSPAAPHCRATLSHTVPQSRIGAKSKAEKKKRKRKRLGPGGSPLPQPAEAGAAEGWSPEVFLSHDSTQGYLSYDIRI